MSKYALGLDFGTESCRAILVDARSGEEIAESVHPYAHGVITDVLPDSDIGLERDVALQNPNDYLEVLQKTIRDVISQRHLPAEDIIGIGIDFTACTVIPIKKDGTPLSNLAPFQNRPHAWCKLWKHHGAQAEADEINQKAIESKEDFLSYYGGAVSSEWMIPKCLEVARKDPDVYEQTDYFIDAGDWIVYQLTGNYARSACFAGYKGCWVDKLGLPSSEFLKSVDPRIEHLEEKWITPIKAPGKAVGVLNESGSKLTGIATGIPVSASIIDAHSGLAGCGISEEHVMCMIMGTSSCHMVLSTKPVLIDGCAGIVKDGILPGFYGYEFGQSAVGDIFGWFSREFCAESEDAALKKLSEKAAVLKPGESGLLALDWMNGNRSVLMNANLTGLIVGLTLQTKPYEVYRALIEATAFSTRKIIETYHKRIKKLVVCGGLTAEPFIMQIYSDVTGLPIQVASSKQTVAVGAAIFGAMAAGKENGGYDDLQEAISLMVKPPGAVYKPNPENKKIFDQLFDEFINLHDFFGYQPEIMGKLKHLSKNI